MEAPGACLLRSCGLTHEGFSTMQQDGDEQDGGWGIITAAQFNERRILAMRPQDGD